MQRVWPRWQGVPQVTETYTVLSLWSPPCISSVRAPSSKSNLASLFSLELCFLPETVIARPESMSSSQAVKPFQKVLSGITVTKEAWQLQRPAVPGSRGDSWQPTPFIICPRAPAAVPSSDDSSDPLPGVVPEPALLLCFLLVYCVFPASSLPWN